MSKYSNPTIRQALNDIIEIIRADGVLTADTGRSVVTVGRHYTATERPAFSLWYGNRLSSVRKSPLHIAQIFQRTVGTKTAQQSIARFQEDN